MLNRRLPMTGGCGYTARIREVVHQVISFDPFLRLRHALSGTAPALLLPVALLLILASCSMQQEMALKSDGSGTASFRVVLKPSLVSAAKDLSAGTSGGSGSASLFDVPKIKEGIAKDPSLELTSLSSPSQGVLEGSVSFTDIAKVFAGQAALSGSDIVYFRKEGGLDTLKLHITRQNFDRVAQLMGIKASPLYQMFGPDQNAATSVSDLDQMMVYVLGEKGPAELAASAIDVTVTVQGRIVSQTGGSVDGNSVRFHIPLVKLLLLSAPLDYSITFS